MKNKGRLVEERDQVVRGGEGKEGYWGTILNKLYCYVVHIWIPNNELHYYV